MQEISDAVVSGATLLRPAFQSLLHLALRHGMDVVLAESVDRFSRDQEDIAGFFKHLSIVGVQLVSASEGDIGHLRVGPKRTMNALCLNDLAERSHRGTVKFAKTQSTHPQGIAISSDLKPNILGIDLGCLLAT